MTNNMIGCSNTAYTTNYQHYSCETQYQFTIICRKCDTKMNGDKQISFEMKQVQITAWPIDININICSIEIKSDVKKLKYDMITRWGEYE